MTTTDLTKIAIIDSCSKKNDYGGDGVPLVHEGRWKGHLETFLKCLESYPLDDVILRNRTLKFYDGDDECDEWFSNDSTSEDLFGFLLDENNHKVDGKIWCNGFLGNRWADTKLNGRMCRLALYTMKTTQKCSLRFPKR